MSKKSLSAVKAKSEELKIPYENLLSAFVIEEAVTAVCESDEAENFRLKNNSILSLEYYRRKAPTRLEYMILSEEELTVRNVIHRMSKIFQNEKKAELWWKYRVEKEDEGICVYLSAKIEELQIPVQLVLEQEKEEPSDPSHEELHPFLKEAFDRYKKPNGYANIAPVGAFLKQSLPDFDIHAYGFSKLYDLIASFPDKYEIKKDDKNHAVPVALYRCK